jgi:hypothetical protein
VLRLVANAAAIKWRHSAIKVKTLTINLKINCVHPPATSDTVIFGLQDKDGNVFAGQSLDDNRLQFSCEVSVKQLDSGQPNFLGVFTHGTVQERFLYLTLKALDKGTWQIVRRIKIHLKSITWEQVEMVMANVSAYLVVTVDGRGTASTKLLSGGWKVQQS